MRSGRISRFRRWLAYRIMPGTTEYRVAMARQRALHELDFIARKHESHLTRESAQWAFDYLRDAVPVREEWDRADVLLSSSEDGDSE